MTPEKKFENEIIKELQARGWFAHHFDANGLDGWPDIIAIKEEQCRLIEVKNGTTSRPEQIAFKTLLMNVCDTVIHVMEKKKGAVILDGVPEESLSDAVSWVIH